MSDTAIHGVVMFARKCAHLTEYAILAILFWRAVRKPVWRDTRPWSWRQAGWCILLVAAYAASDEFHQLFVPGREGCVRDVCIDTLGGIIGMLLVWGLHSAIHRRSKPATSSA